jgi:hypothetical protein
MIGEGWKQMVVRRLLLFNREIDLLKETGWDYSIISAKEGFYVVAVDIPKEVLAKAKRSMKNRAYMYKGKEPMR